MINKRQHLKKFKELNKAKTHVFTDLELSWMVQEKKKLSLIRSDESIHGYASSDSSFVDVGKEALLPDFNVKCHKPLSSDSEKSENGSNIKYNRWIDKYECMNENKFKEEMNINHIRRKNKNSK